MINHRGITFKPKRYWWRMKNEHPLFHLCIKLKGFENDDFHYS